jgi:hypothetical protein
MGTFWLRWEACAEWVSSRSWPLASRARSVHRDDRGQCGSSKLALVRSLQQQTLSSSLAERLGVSDADEDELYEAMDWLLGRQARIKQPWPNATCVRHAGALRRQLHLLEDDTVRPGSATRAMGASIARRSSSDC